MRTFIPPTSFVSSPETEKVRLLYSCANIASGFYTRHGLLVQPKVYPKYKSYTEVLPEIVKNFSPQFWKDAAYGGNLMPKKLSKRMWAEVKNLNLTPVENKVISKFESDWIKVEKNAWEALHGMFSKEVKWIGSLEVRLTKIGSQGSHYLLLKKRYQHLVINLREDSKALDILNLLVLALIYPQAEELGMSFTHRQTVRSFIMSRPQFKKIYKDFLPKTFHNPKIPPSLKRKSDEYLLYLGIPKLVDPIISIQKNLQVFGAKENKLLKELINRKNEIITYDEIADFLWGTGNFKSYWAINKIVQRIMKKVGSLGIDNFKIIGVRSQGYKLQQP